MFNTVLTTAGFAANARRKSAKVAPSTSVNAVSVTSPCVSLFSS
jgi:hypothetical protein